MSGNNKTLDHKIKAVCWKRLAVPTPPPSLHEALLALGHNQPKKKSTTTTSKPPAKKSTDRKSVV